jgi:hypothetical protein
MPRPERGIVEGGLSHVNNRIGRSERALDLEQGPMPSSTCYGARFSAMG